MRKAEHRDLKQREDDRLTGRIEFADDLSLFNRGCSVSKRKKGKYRDTNSVPTAAVQFGKVWRQRKYGLPLVVILMITVSLYSRALQNDILSWDDHWHITFNHDIRSLSIDNIKAMFTSYYGNMYQPLTTLTFALNYHFFGLNSMVYHATNVLFHLVNVVLVFFLVLRLSRRREIAVIAACLFGIHPMHVESVAWITERKDVVYAFFYLYALISYVRFIQGEGGKYYWFTFLFYVCSLFSKAAAITCPVVLCLIDVYVQRKGAAKRIIEKLPLLLLSLIFGYIAFQSQSESMSYPTEHGLTILDRPFLVMYSISYYCIRFFAPMNLSAIHLLPRKVDGLLPIEYYLACVPIVILIYLGTRKGVFRREYMFGMLFFLITISLSVHIVPVGMAIVGERYVYVPYIGFYYLVGRFYCSIIDRSPILMLAWKKVIYGVAALVVIVLGLLTYQRVGAWKSTQILFRDASTKARDTKEANHVQALGFVFEARTESMSGNYSGTIESYTKAIALDPEYDESYNNRGLAKTYLYDFIGAFNDFTKAIELNPKLGQVYMNRAMVGLRLHKNEDACADLRIALGLGFTQVLHFIKKYCDEEAGH